MAVTVVLPKRVYGTLLQSVQNVAARLITGTSRCDHTFETTPLVNNNNNNNNNKAVNLQ